MSAERLPFDEVHVVRDGLMIVYAVDVFLELPLRERVEYILRQDVSFYMRGVRVDRRHALNALRSLTART